MKVNFRKTAGCFTGTIEIDGLVLGQELLCQTEADTLLEEFEAAVSHLKQLLDKNDKPTVVIHVEGGCLTGVTTSREMTAILADYDVNDGESKTTPYDIEARIVNVSVDVCPEEIDYWIALVED